MGTNQRIIQARVVPEPKSGSGNSIRQEIVLYGPDGKPLDLEDLPSKKELRSIKSRLTKLEKIVKEWEAE